jgi:hypothetical protein
MTPAKLTAAASGAQGVLGAGCISAGAFLIAGLGPALVVLGVLFLLGAWSSR